MVLPPVGEDRRLRAPDPSQKDLERCDKKATARHEMVGMYVCMDVGASAAL